MHALKDEKIIDRWIAVVDGANGKTEQFFRRTAEGIKQYNPPSVHIEKKEVSTGLIKGLLGKKRTFFVVNNDLMIAHKVYIGAKDYGNQLIVSWYLMLQADLTRKLLGKKRGTTEITPYKMDIFDIEELTGYATTIHRSAKEAIEEICKEVDFDFTKVDQKSKGFLNIS